MQQDLIFAPPFLDPWPRRSSGDHRAEEPILLSIPHILSIGLRQLGGTHLLSKCFKARSEELTLTHSQWAPRA